MIRGKRVSIRRTRQQPRYDAKRRNGSEERFAPSSKRKSFHIGIPESEVT